MCVRDLIVVENLLEVANPTLFGYWHVFRLPESVRAYEKRWVTLY